MSNNNALGNYFVYREFMEQLLLGEISFRQDWHCLKVILTLDYIPNVDHRVYSDVDKWEITGPGYTKGGQNLEFSGTVKHENTITVNVNSETTWANSSITANGAIVMTRQQGEGTEDYQLLVGYFPMVDTKTSENGNFTIAWSNHGLMTFKMP